MGLLVVYILCITPVKIYLVTEIRIVCRNFVVTRYTMSSSETDVACDPFESTNTDEDADFVPSEEESLSENKIQQPVNPQKGKKRIRLESRWKRSVSKKCRVQGLEYINTSGHVVPAKKEGKPCSCKFECFKKVTRELRSKLRESFYKLKTKDLQDSFLAGLIKVKAVERHRPGSGVGKPKTVSYEYFVSNFSPLLLFLVPCLVLIQEQNIWANLYYFVVIVSGKKWHRLL